jgi:hypothetical protein
MKSPGESPLPGTMNSVEPARVAGPSAVVDDMVDSAADQSRWPLLQTQLEACKTTFAEPFRTADQAAGDF